jgi:hypothetical protein
MFLETDNPYKFRYLITGITGPGINTVYLPPKPPDSEILFKEEQHWLPNTDLNALRMSDEMIEWVKEWDEILKINPDYVHPHAKRIIAFEDREWERREKGVWFWNDGEAVYMTGFHYWYCTVWEPYFGIPKFRDPDKEIIYWIQYCEEDPNSFGTLLNTIRRFGKSAIVGAWLIFGVSSHRNWRGGMQGESDDKIKDFYSEFIQEPFYKIPYYFQPIYDTTTLQKNSIVFDYPPKRGEKKGQKITSDQKPLSSKIDYRTSGESKYDQAVLHRYVMEEPGKTLEADVKLRWGFVKPCLKRGFKIRGKAILPTTVEYMEVDGKGGMAYKNLFYESDVDKRGPDGRTESGLYMAYLAARFSLEDGIDPVTGIPDADFNKRLIREQLVSVEKKPREYAMLKRQYPDSIKDIFYISTEKCDYNVTILMQRQVELDMNDGYAERGDFLWSNNQRDSRVYWSPNENGACLVSQLFDNDNEESNLVEQVGIHPTNSLVNLWKPKNAHKFEIGTDPIQAGILSGKRQSLPVLYVKRKYDPLLDGPMTEENLIKRAEEKYKYKSNTLWVQYDKRFGDPNLYFEYAIRICRYFGAPLHVEAQKAAIIGYFHSRGYGNFIMGRIQDPSREQTYFNEDALPEGTHASSHIIELYHSLNMTYIEYFGHTIPFKELIEDLLLFNPKKTKEHDYTVALGFTLMAGIRNTPKKQEIFDLKDVMRTFDNSGAISRPL